MLDRLKSAGETLGGIVVLILVLSVSFTVIWAFFKGAEWLVLNALQWIVGAAWIVLVLDVVFLLPLTIFRRVRPYSAVALLISSYLFGLTTWLYGFIFTYGLWGGFALVLGLCMFGVGVVFMGVLATALKGMWEATATLIVMTILTFGVRFFSIWLGETTETVPQSQPELTEPVSFT